MVAWRLFERIVWNISERFWLDEFFAIQKNATRAALRNY